MVETAEDGREGLYHATDGGFDAIVLDRMLPGLDGLSLIKSLRAAGLKTPVLMLTAMSAVDERVKGLRSGADDYLVKPFSFPGVTCPNRSSAETSAGIRRNADAHLQRP